MIKKSEVRATRFRYFHLIAWIDNHIGHNLREGKKKKKKKSEARRAHSLRYFHCHDQYINISLQSVGPWGTDRNQPSAFSPRSRAAGAEYETHNMYINEA